MTIAELLAYIDEVNPNSFSNAVKTVWINEAEGLVQTDVMMLASTEVITYVYSKVWSGTGISFTDTETMVLPSASGMSAGGYITISGLSTYSANNKSTAVKILTVSADQKTLTFAEDTFSVSGETGDSGTATVTFSGANTELLVYPPHDKLYRSYLQAMIFFANGEYTKYNNSIALFNLHMSEYMEWYSRIYNPSSEVADDETFAGYYISAYGIAVKNGYDGTEEEWLLSLVGDTGAEGAGLKILGMYATVEALAAAVTDPSAGDGYTVGTSDSNVYYTWNGSEWVNHGTLKGDSGVYIGTSEPDTALVWIDTTT